MTFVQFLLVFELKYGDTNMYKQIYKYIYQAIEIRPWPFIAFWRQGGEANRNKIDWNLGEYFFLGKAIA